MTTASDQPWRRSSFCESGACVEVRVRSDGIVELRRVVASPNSATGLSVRRWGGCTPDEWAAFVAGVKAGEFD